MKKIACLWLIVLLCFACTACQVKEPDAVSSTVSEQYESFFHTEEDGTILVIRLESNPTTGYRWNASLEDDTVCRIVDTVYTPDAVEEGLCGGGGIWTATVRGLRQGETALTLQYARSWEESAIEEHQLILSVDTDGHISATKSN